MDTLKPLKIDEMSRVLDLTSYIRQLDLIIDPHIDFQNFQNWLN